MYCLILLLNLLEAPFHTLVHIVLVVLYDTREIDSLANACSIEEINLATYGSVIDIQARIGRFDPDNVYLATKTDNAKSVLQSFTRGVMVRNLMYFSVE